VDGITGATISSDAIANMLNKSASFWIPRVQRRAGDFRQGGG
ncbi:MAG: FMN-binding protein, partial [Acidobacteriota bacterium]